MLAGVRVGFPGEFKGHVRGDVGCFRVSLRWV